MANIQHIAKKTEPLIKIFKDSVQKVKDTIKTLFDGDKEKVLMKHVVRLEKSVV
jgi:hypothetical protein